MELKQEQVEDIFQFIIDQKIKSDETPTPAKKVTGIIFTIVNLIAFFITCTITIAYGISSYRETVKAVTTFDGRIKLNEEKLNRLDSLMTRTDTKVGIMYDSYILNQIPKKP
jgi:hypothetical protein